MAGSREVGQHACVPTKPPPPQAALKVLVVAAGAEAEDVGGALSTSTFPVAVTSVSDIADAVPSAAWHDAVILAHESPTAASALRGMLDAKGLQVPLVMVLPESAASAKAEALASCDAVIVRDAAGGWRDDLLPTVAQIARRAEHRAAREQAEAELRRQQEMFHGFMRSSPAVAYMKDASGRYEWVNPAFEKLFGLTTADWKHRTDAEIWGEEAGTLLHENDLAVLASGEALEVEETLPQDDGIHHWLAFKFPWKDREGRPVVGGMAVDVTLLRKAEEERRQIALRLEQARRLESLGSLAATIAHDFNNLLLSVMGNAGLALLEISPSSKAAGYLDQIEQAAIRAAELTHQVLTLAGRGSLLLDSVDLRRFIEQRIFGMRSRVTDRVQLRLELGDEPTRILADPAQLEEILFALVERAAAAMPHGGHVVVRTGTRRFHEDELHRLFLGDALTPGQLACLEVEDDGPALSHEEQAQLVEPDFSIRPTGRATGLPALLGLVRGHRGAIGVDSSEGVTRVRIVLPLAGERVVADAEPPAPSVTGGTVLVVDDEEPVRAVATAALERFGWEAMTARDGEEALELFRRDPSRVAAVLLDVTMPGMSGLDVLDRMRTIRPDVKIILSSGYEESDILRGEHARKADDFLAKPYRPAKLLRTLRKVVDGEAAEED